MKKIYIKVGVHPRYSSLINFPPEGFEYKISGKPNISKYYSSARTNNSLRRLSEYLTKYIGIPRVFYYFDANDCDLIYSTRGIIPLNRKPFIVEGEHVYSFVGMKPENYGRLQKFWINLLLSRENAKKIIMVTKKAAEIMKREFPKISYKVDYVYQVPKYHKIEKKPHKGINITIVNLGDVYSRGFRILFNTVKRLKERYDVNLLVNTNNLLEEDAKELPNYGKLITSGAPEAYEKLWSVTDIFVYLTFVDTAGNVIYDAMNAGVPIILSNIFSNPEKVENYVNGFLVDLPFSLWDNNGMYTPIKVDLRYYSNRKIENDLYKKLEYLINNDKERRKMGEYNEKLIREGKFSIKARNEKLKKIFEEAIS